jgi:hypothetical protein
MKYDPGYTKANVSHEANELLKELAREKTEKTGHHYYVYDIIDDLLKEKYPDRFEKK